MLFLQMRSCSSKQGKHTTISTLQVYSNSTGYTRHSAKKKLFLLPSVSFWFAYLQSSLKWFVQTKEFRSLNAAVSHEKKLSFLSGTASKETCRRSINQAALLIFKFNPLANCLPLSILMQIVWWGRGAYTHCGVSVAVSALSVTCAHALASYTV